MKTLALNEVKQVSGGFGPEGFHGMAEGLAAIFGIGVTVAFVLGVAVTLGSKALMRSA